ncbi:MAG TPA: hypothetical protein VHT91_16925 [Kofleriaceae bacterium]|nr:hypothetical protein [Kofleriaceae bacterium]
MVALAAAALSVAAAIDARPAGAQVVLEQYHASRPDEADAIMAILRDELGENHAVARPEHIAPFLFHAPRPAITDPGLTSDMLIDKLELAAKSYIKVSYDTALVQLTTALAEADANYGLAVEDADVKSAMARAQVALALTYKKLSEQVAEKIRPEKDAEKRTGKPSPILPELVAAKNDLDAKAREAMTTYIRGSREPVARRMFGPPGELFYNEVRKSLDTARRANLAISVSEPDAQLFVNGLLVGRGATFAADQLPGPYCIIARVGRQMLRYDVTMDSRHPATLDIDWSLDSVLHVSKQWVGLMLTEGVTEGRYVRPIALRMGGELSLIFVGVRRERDYLAVYGYYYDRAYRGGVVRWSGETHVTGARDELKLRDLARLLTTGKQSPHVVPIGSAEVVASPLDSRPWLGYAAGAGATGALALGAFSLSKEYGCNRDPDCKYSYPRAAAVGYTSLGLGVALGAFAVYWLAREPSPARSSRITVLPSRSSVTVSLTRQF